MLRKLLIFASSALLWLAIAPEASAQYDASCFETTSVLDSGRWVKIKVTETGLHQITYDELRDMGFDDPELVAVYGYSGLALSSHRLTNEIPDDLPPVPVYYAADKLVFYAEGDTRLTPVSGGGSSSSTLTYAALERNFYSTYSVYYLTDELPAAGPERLSAITTVKSNLTWGFAMENHSFEKENPGMTGPRFFGTSFVKEPVQTVDFALEGFTTVDKANPMYNVNVAAQFNSSSTYKITLPSGETATSQMLRGTSSHDLSYNAMVDNYVDYNLQPSAEGKYSMTLDFSASPLGYAAIQNISACYPRSVDMTGLDELELVFKGMNANVEVAMQGAPAGVVAWDITDPLNIKSFTIKERANNIRGFGYRTSHSSLAGGYNKVVAFNPDGEFRSVEYIDEAENQNLHSMATPDMLILTTAELAPAARALADLHRDHHNMDVAVVIQNQVYNEFSAGNYHILGLRRFIKMLYERTPGKLQSLILMGAPTYDNRGLTMNNEEESHATYLPGFVNEAFEDCGHYSRAYTTDAYFGMLGEDTGTFDPLTKEININVGRIPAEKLEDAMLYVQKVDDYLNHVPSSAYPTKVLLMSDDGDANGHLKDAEAIGNIVRKYSPSSTLLRAYNSLYQMENGSALKLRNLSIGMLTRGVGYWHYSGHAGVAGLTLDDLWPINVAKTTSYSVPPFTMLSACRTLYMDHRMPYLGYEMLFKRDGGSIAIVGALCEVYKDQNQVLAANVAEQFFSAKPGTTVGDVYRKAHNAAVNYSYSLSTVTERNKLRINLQAFNLAGDPALPLRAPAYNIALNTINGETVPAQEEYSIPSGQTVTISGTVTDADGNLSADFTGKGYISIFGGEKVMKVINADTAASRNETVTLDEDQIYEGAFDIEGGSFTTELFLPAPTFPDAINRVALFAVDGDGEKIAMGGHVNINIGDFPDDEIAESDVPVIEEMYLNSPSFSDGDIINSDPVLVARIAANNFGVVGSTTSLGRSAQLTLDGSRTFPMAASVLTPTSDGGATVRFPIDGITNGRHTLTLRVYNYLGEATSRSINFTMANVPAKGKLSVTEAPAAGQATIMLDHNIPTEPTGRLIVKDAKGHVVYTDADATFPYVWDLNDVNGKDVPNGRYLIEAFITGDGMYGATETTEFIIHRP